MGRTGIRMTLGAAVVALSACALAQDFSQKPKSPSSDELPGKQLIVWTETQKPHPIPVTSPERYQASSHPQILTGTILSQGQNLLFATANRANYRIENQGRIRAFTGHEVRISGNVDPSTRSVHVVSIEQPIEQP
jgi:hypothetical protein